MDSDIFGGVIVQNPETQVNVLATLASHGGGGGASGFSGFSGGSGISGWSGAAGGGGGGGGQSGFSGYSGPATSGFSGFSGFSSSSGFSGISGRSGYSGYSGVPVSGFSGYSGAGFSGYSGYSSLSGFSAYSGYSAPPGPAGSAGASGFSGFSGGGGSSTPGGSPGQMQWNNSGALAGDFSLTSDGTVTNIRSDSTFFHDGTDPSKQISFSLVNLTSPTNVGVLVPNSPNPVIVAANAGSANLFVTGITPLGQVTNAQPAFSNLSGLAAFGQLDRTTTVVPETATITIAQNTKIKSTATGILTTIAFSGGASVAQGRRLDLDVTGGPYTLTIPSCRRLGSTAAVTSITVPTGYYEFSWEFIGAEYVMSDSVADPGLSGYSGYSGAGFSGFSGYSSTAPGVSGFSGYSGPQLLAFSTKTDIDYTLVIGDQNTGVKMTSASPHNLTVPANATVAFPIGTQIIIEQGSAGLVTLVAAGGVTIQGPVVTSGQYSILALIKQATDTWFVATGSPGVSGFSGYSSPGQSGFSGYSGGSGFSGYSSTVAGSSGFSGYSGQNPGASGYSGYSGKSGYSGYSGYSGPQLFTFSTQTNTDYTLVLGDANTGVNMTSAAAHNLTIPLNASVAFPIGTQIAIEQGGAGVVTIVPTGGVTVNGGLKTSGQYTVVVLIKQGTDTWLSGGGISGYSGYSAYSGYSGYSAFSGFSGTFGWTKLTVAGSNASTTGQTLVDITGLRSGVLTLALYEIHAVLKVTTSATNTGTQYGIDVGGGAISAAVNALVHGTTTAVAAAVQTLNSPDVATTAYLTANSLTGTIEIRGWVNIISGTNPTIGVQHLKVTSGTSTVLIGSYLEYRPA